jgi:hypothetical protein
MCRVHGVLSRGVEEMLRRAGLVAAVLAVLVGVVPATASATPGYCGIDWGSGPKSATEPSGPMVGLRAGSHDCYDRLVFDVRGAGTGY